MIAQVKVNENDQWLSESYASEEDNLVHEVLAKDVDDKDVEDKGNDNDIGECNKGHHASPAHAVASPSHSLPSTSASRVSTMLPCKHSGQIQDSSPYREVDFRNANDRKAIGLRNYGLDKSKYVKQQLPLDGEDYEEGVYQSKPVFFLPHASIEKMEERARNEVVSNPYELMILSMWAALKVMCIFLITLETLMVIFLTVGLTCYWYFANISDEDWSGNDLDFILLAFAVISPITAALSMAFTRRERALQAVNDFRSFSHHLYLAHCLWDWPENGGRAGAEASGKVNWVEHCDAVLAQLIGLGDELSRFLSLPTATKSRHRMTKSGRKEASRIMEVSYYLLESMSTQRLTRLTVYSERIKKIGLPSGEVSRLRQYERFLSNNIDQLRMVKFYRTPQSLRSFARVFTFILPPFYAPSFSQVARGTQSLTMGILFAIIAAVGLCALFEGLNILEDPFTAYRILDGIDVREEFEVLHFTQLISTRSLCFPDASQYPPGRRAALPSSHSVSSIKQRNHHIFGHPPEQPHHKIPSQVTLTPPASNMTVKNTTDANSLDTPGSYNDDKDPEVSPCRTDHADLELGCFLVDRNKDGRNTAYADHDDDATVATRTKSHHRFLSKDLSREGSLLLRGISRRCNTGSSHPT